MLKKQTKIMAMTMLSLVIFSAILFAQDSQEIVLTIEDVSAPEKLAHFNKGDSLRKQMKFNEAIAEYKKVISAGESCDKESEAHYNIGLCQTWLGKLDSANAVFNDIVKTYPDDGLAIGFAQFGLSWIDFQKKNFEAAIAHLQKTLDSGLCEDQEHNAVMQFEIGRIYLAGLNDMAKAREIFKLVLEKYPDAKITNHPFLKDFQN